MRYSPAALVSPLPPRAISFPRDVHAVSYPSGFLLFHYAQSCLVIRLLNVSFYLFLPRFTCVTIICLRQWPDVDVPFFLSLYVCVCIYLSCVCMYVYIYIQCFTRFHSVLFVVYYQFVSLHRCKERKRIRSIFSLLFVLFVP